MRNGARSHHGLCSQQKPKSCYILHTDPNRQQELFVLLTYYLSLFPHPTLLCFFNCGNLHITHNLSLEPFQVCRSVREHSHLCNHHHHSSPELTHLLRLTLQPLNCPIAPSPSPWQPQFHVLPLDLTTLSSFCKLSHRIFVLCDWLTSLSAVSSKYIHFTLGFF